MPCIRQCKVIFLSPFPPWKVHLFCRLCTDRYLVIDECRHICQRDDIPLRRRKKNAWPRYPWWHAGNRNLEILSACYVNHRNREILFAMQICSQGQEHVFWDFFLLQTTSWISVQKFKNFSSLKTLTFKSSDKVGWIFLYRVFFSSIQILSENNK